MTSIVNPQAAAAALPTTYEDWQAAYGLSPEHRGPFTWLSRELVKPLYTEADLPDPETIGLPGVYPFTRGVYPSMYRGRLWTVRQFAGFGTAEETNERFRNLLDHGQQGLSTAFDMPSLMGHDSDHPLALGEVGREGVAVDTLDDMQMLFEGIDVGDVSVSMTINAPAAIMLAFYVVAAERQGIPPDRLSGTIQADSALRDAAMEVIYTGLHQTPEQIVETVIQEDADAIGLSILSGAHMTLVPRIVALLREQGVDDVIVTVGGTIPGHDIPELERLGVAAVFTPGTGLQDIIDFLL
jgi:methylmalonyl-CoA mutase cobalamin-binding domain/chain